MNHAKLGVVFFLFMILYFNQKTTPVESKWILGTGNIPVGHLFLQISS